MTFDRNRGIPDPKKWIPSGRVVSRSDCLDLFPGLERKGLTGAAIFYDGQMRNPARLALSFLKSAVNAGAEVANYVEATEFLRVKDRVQGVSARDLLTGEDFEVRGRMVLNASGPWADILKRRSFCSGSSFDRGLWSSDPM